MYRLCFNSTTLRNLPIFDALTEIVAAGYEGVELTLNATHMDPLSVSDARVDEVRRFCAENDIHVVCVACGGDKLLGDIPYEPSLICSDPAGRERRLRLIERSVEIASRLGSPVLNFNSGMLRPDVSPRGAGVYLGEALERLLDRGGDLVLVLEPEPGFFVGTTDAAIDVIREVDSPQLRLNLDIGHVFCSQPEPYAAIERAMPYVRHIHIEDIKGDVHHHEIPGDGDIDFSRVLTTIARSGYEQFVSVELHHHDMQWERALTESRAYLSALMRALR